MWRFECKALSQTEAVCFHSLFKLLLWSSTHPSGFGCARLFHHFSARNLGHTIYRPISTILSPEGGGIKEAASRCRCQPVEIAEGVVFQKMMTIFYIKLGRMVMDHARIHWSCPIQPRVIKFCTYVHLLIPDFLVKTFKHHPLHCLQITLLGLLRA